MSVRDDIQKLYIGYLGRPADAAGLDYWENDINSGVMTMEQLRSNLVNEQPEYAEIYGGKTRTELVTKIYTNLFERAPDAAGLEYWVDGDGSTVNADQLIVAFLNAASTDDQAVVENKLEVANYYTAELGGADTFDKAEAATFIDDVDGTDASVTDAKADIDAAVPPAPVEGEEFTLTTSADTPEMTTGDDTVDGSTTVNSFTANDTIIDESTEDSDTLTVKTSVADVKATVKNIEDVQYEWTSNADLDVDATNMTGNAFTFTAEGLAFSGNANITNAGKNDFTFDDNVVGTATFTNIIESSIDAGQAGTVVVDEGTATTVGQKTNASITVNKATATVTNTAADLVQQLTLAASVDSTITLDDGAAASGIDEVLTVSGENDIKIKGVVTGEKIVNDKSSGTLTVNSTDAGATNVAKIDADNIQLSANAGAITVGADQVLEVVTGGAPTSIDTLATLSNVTTDLKTNVDIAALDITAGTKISTLNLEAAKDVSVALTADATQTTFVSGSGKLTLASTGVSAVDASAATADFAYSQAGDDITGVTGSSTAKNTIDFTNITTENATFIGGSAKDTVDIAAASGTVKITGGAGDDVVNVSGDLTGKATIDLGAGTGDVVAITAVNGVAAAGGASKVSFAGVEEIKAIDLTVFNNVQLSGESYKMTNTDGGSNNFIVEAYDSTGAATESTIDLSSLEFNSVVGSDFSTVTINGDANATGTKDAIMATALDDTITGGLGKDTIDISQGGNDTIVVTAGDSTWTSDNDKMDSITGFNAVATPSAYDQITFDNMAVGEAVADIDVKGAITGSTGTEVALATIDANGILTLSGVDSNQIDTLKEWTSVAEMALEASTAAADLSGNGDTDLADGETVAFEFDGNTYLYNVADGTSTANTVDDFDIVELVGVTGVTAVDVTGTAADNTIVVA